MPLTEPDNPDFCYYLKWVYNNEVFAIGKTLNGSYGGLGRKSVTYIPSEQ